MDQSSRAYLVVPPVPEILVDLRVRSGRSVPEDLGDLLALLSPPAPVFQQVPGALLAQLNQSILEGPPAPVFQRVLAALQLRLNQSVPVALPAPGVLGALQAQFNPLVPGVLRVRLNQSVLEVPPVPVAPPVPEVLGALQVRLNPLAPGDLVPLGNLRRQWQR
jgi:hypothetical protein